MDYESASRLSVAGGWLDGYVKCTYAMIFNENGERLFSFQRGGAIFNRAMYEYEQQIGYTQKKAISVTIDKQPYERRIYIENMYNVGVKWMIPIVRAISSEGEDGEYVRVWLTDEAKEWIRAKIESNLKVYRAVNTSDWYNLSRVISNDEPVYVKECAIKWIPQEVRSVELDEKIKAAKAELDRAKALLLIASGTNII